jgi:phosphohistidine phosphatase SixA
MTKVKLIDRYSLELGVVASLLLAGCLSQPAVQNRPASPPTMPSPPSISSLESPSASQTPAMTDTTQNTDADIWIQMQTETGYVVLLRHAQTVEGTGDPPGFQLDDCKTQRNLSAAGRAQATQIGQTFRDRNIPIQQVLSSQYCRCLDTARLLNLGTVVPDPALNSTYVNNTNEAEQTAQVRQKILNHRNTHGVIIMVSHFVNIGDISGVSPPEGGAVVMRTNEQGEFEVAASIQDW